MVEPMQGRDSHFISFSLATGAALSRTNISTVLGGAGCGATLNGLYMLDGKQHGDHQTRIEHAQPNCFSRELYKGVLDGASHGVFNGKVYVHPIAQQTDGKQTNNNLLLSEHAQIDTKPQLEIFADDVKCTHGATVGRLDDTALFYMKSRAISAEESKKYLDLVTPKQLRDAYHTDTSWRLVPTWGAVLRAVDLPPLGGDTIWVDAGLVWRELPQDIKERLEGRLVTHDFRSALARAGHDYPVVAHPIVRTHRETGEKIVWVVRRMEIDFRGPARIDDILTIDTRTEDISGARIFMAQQLKRGDEVLVEARVEAAIIGENGRPRRFPKEWVAAFMPKVG